MKNMKIWKKLLLAMVVLFTVSTGTVKAEEERLSLNDIVQQDIGHKKDVRSMRNALRRTYSKAEIKELKEDIQGVDFEGKGILEEALDEQLENYKWSDIYTITIVVIFITTSIILSVKYIL